jgi:hypothetical protein
MKMYLLKICAISLLLLATTSVGLALLPARVSAEQPDRAGDRLSPAAFVDPPVNVRPGSFWDWLNGAITKEQITRDLEAMKHGGMRGGEIWYVAACADPDGRVPAGPVFLGPESTRLIAHAICEADRLGWQGFPRQGTAGLQRDSATNDIGPFQAGSDCYTQKPKLRQKTESND